MISDSISRAACRAPWPGVEGSVIISDGSTSGLYATPCRSLSRSASACVTPSTWTTSVVRYAPANRSDARCRIFPSWKTATPVEPPPTSTRATPSSLSSSVSTAYDAARGSSTRSATRYPARCTLLRRFWAAVDCTVTRYISTSSRVPAHMPPATAAVLREPHARPLGPRLARQIAHALGDHGARLGAAQIEAGHEPAVPRHAPRPPPPVAGTEARRRRTTTCPA